MSDENWETTEYTIRVKHLAFEDMDVTREKVEELCEELSELGETLGVEAAETKALVTEFDG